MPDPLAELLAGASEAEARALADQLEEIYAARRRAAWRPYPWQTCPGIVAAQGAWVQMGGRGTGKTDGAARYVVEHVAGPACDRRLPGGHRISIVAPTLGDAVESCVEGPSGLKAHDNRVVLRGGARGYHVRWPSGAVARLFGGSGPDDIERLRSGGNRCLVWLEEVAAIRHLGPVLHHAAFGLRIGTRPHFVASTTPKPRKELRDLLADPLTLITRGRTAAAHHLDPAVRAMFEQRYGGTRLGRQELEGELLDDVEGALWTYDRIESGRTDSAPEMVSVAVGMDPSVSVTESSDECGLIAAGLGVDGIAYVLADRSGQFAGVDAARRAWQLWADVAANVLVYEDNQGKRWVDAVLRQAWADMQREGLLPPGAPPLRPVTAVVGKRLRAEPIATLYELSPPRVRHAGTFPEMEDQQCTWVPESGTSPDRLDALVHVLTYLMLRDAAAGAASPVGTSRAALSGRTGPGARLGPAGGRPGIVLPPGVRRGR